MTLLKRILQEKRTLVTFVAVILVLDVGSSVLVYRLSKRVSDAETRKTAAEGLLEQRKANYVTVDETSANKDIADSDLQRFYTDVLPVGLAKARSISSLILVNLVEDTNLVLERGDSLVDKERGSRLSRLQTTMVLAGEYEDIRQFIFELETAPEFILIEDVILSQGDESDAELVLRLGVATYYLAEPDAAL